MNPYNGRNMTLSYLLIALLVICNVTGCSRSQAKQDEKARHEQIVKATNEKFNVKLMANQPALVAVEIEHRNALAAEEARHQSALVWIEADSKTSKATGKTAGAAN